MHQVFFMGDLLEIINWFSIPNWQYIIDIYDYGNCYKAVYLHHQTSISLDLIETCFKYYHMYKRLEPLTTLEIPVHHCHLYYHLLPLPYQMESQCGPLPAELS